MPECSYIDGVTFCRQVVHSEGMIQWDTADGLAPPDTPVCGLLNELCPADQTGQNATLFNLLKLRLPFVGLYVQ